MHNCGLSFQQHKQHALYLIIALPDLPSHMQKSNEKHLDDDMQMSWKKDGKKA